jgi:choline-sulfatase
VDQNLGRVLDALVESGQWDNTVVIFTSDHGEMGASHGLHHKSPTMYEENLRVPLWISDPRRMSDFRQCDELVSNIDLAPTLCSIAGVRWPGPLPGTDLDGILEGDSEINRDQVFAEGGLLHVAHWRGLRTREWKYWHYSNGEELLFNIAEDPYEMNNLAEDNEAGDILTGFRERVRQWRRETNDPVKDFMS